MRATGSWLILRTAQAAGLALLLLWGGGLQPSTDEADGAVQNFVRKTARGWCQAHGERADLQVLVVDLRYRPEPPAFDESEGVVVAPVGLDVPGLQKTIEVASFPPHLRRLDAEGIGSLAWTYPGRRNRSLRYVGLALVERGAERRSVAPVRPTFEKMPSELRDRALARAAELEEHELHKCAAFATWARTTAGEPPYTDQILRLIRGSATRPGRDSGSEDICADIRKGRLSDHRAQVAVVMGARELGIPVMGFASASRDAIFLVGTFTDELGWIFADVKRPDAGWFQGGPALLTQAPLLGSFSACQHDFWYPQAAAYAQAQWGDHDVSRTEWQGQHRLGEPPTHTTAAKSLSLAEACK